MLASFSETGTDDDDPTLTSDLLELYFNRSGQIFVTTRTSLLGGWSAPVAVVSLTGPTGSADTTPEVSLDGLTMYFATNRPPTAGGLDIWVSTRGSRAGAWGAPVRVGELGSPSDDSCGSFTADGLHMALTISVGSDTNIAETKRDSLSALWGTPALLTALNSAATESSPTYTDDGLGLIFDSARTGVIDLFQTQRTSLDGAWSAPTPVSELNTLSSGETDPWVSPDGHHMFFASSRSPDGHQHIYETSR